MYCAVAPVNLGQATHSPWRAFSRICRRPSILLLYSQHWARCSKTTTNWPAPQAALVRSSRSLHTLKVAFVKCWERQDEEARPGALLLRGACQLSCWPERQPAPGGGGGSHAGLVLLLIDPTRHHALYPTASQSRVRVRPLIPRPRTVVGESFQSGRAPGRVEQKAALNSYTLLCMCD